MIDSVKRENLRNSIIVGYKKSVLLPKLTEKDAKANLNLQIAGDEKKVVDNEEFLKFLESCE